MKRVRLTALAEFDLVEAQDFYAQSGEWVLDHFMESISAALDSLADFAGIHAVHYGHHRMGVPHFPFSVYYDIEGGAREFRQALANGGYGHHQAIIYGNHVKELIELGKVCGFEVEYFH